MPTFANGIPVVHKGSGHVTVAFPDVCMTPSFPSPIPIPYPNIGQAGDTIGGPTTVQIDGNMPMVKDAKYAMSSGDEGGTAGGGVACGLIKGPCEFIAYSFDVMFEGRNACRFGDPTFHNQRNAVGP